MRTMRANLNRGLAALLLGLGLALALLPPPALGQDTLPPGTAAAHAEAPAAADGAASDLERSRELAERLHEAEGLADVSVTVHDGVAELQGVVLGADDRERAAQLAAQQPGITSVENAVTISTRFTDRLETAAALAADRLTRLLAALPLLLVALAVVALAWWLGRWLGRRVSQRIARRSWQSENPYFAGLVQQVVQWLVLLGGVLVALGLLDATALVGAVMGSAGILGLALGFAFRDIAENYVAGVLLSIRRPFAPGELLRIDNTHEGRVAALTPRATVLVTADGNRLTLPNALVFKSVVLNYSSNRRRRLQFTIPIDAGDSIREAQETAITAIRAIDGVLEDPAPSWAVEAQDAAAVALSFFAWVDQERSDLGKVRSEAIHGVRVALEGAGIRRPRTIQYTAELEDASAPPLAPCAPDEAAPPADTSVSHELDDHLAAEQRAHASEDLLPP